ncbi:MAG: hypothetical protein BWZ08_02642 [candidate division BRC1 bacterium ADurb.BinA292]|nr:MAG: hypothetical protein BWZ08_02642 [candidate division BRC1 bacterium ADurb.BinA292]
MQRELRLLHRRQQRQIVEERGFRPAELDHVGQREPIELLGRLRQIGHRRGRHHINDRGQVVLLPGGSQFVQPLPPQPGRGACLGLQPLIDVPQLGLRRRRRRGGRLRRRSLPERPVDRRLDPLRNKIRHLRQRQHERRAVADQPQDLECLRHELRPRDHDPDGAEDRFGGVERAAECQRQLRVAQRVGRPGVGLLDDAGRPARVLAIGLRVRRAPALEPAPGEFQLVLRERRITEREIERAAVEQRFLRLRQRLLDDQLDDRFGTPNALMNYDFRDDVHA